MAREEELVTLRTPAATVPGVLRGRRAIGSMVWSSGRS